LREVDIAELFFAKTQPRLFFVCSWRLRETNQVLFAISRADLYLRKRESLIGQNCWAGQQILAEEVAPQPMDHGS
jgi:hypothetical protein